MTISKSSPANPTPDEIVNPDFDCIFNRGLAYDAHRKSSALQAFAKATKSIDASSQPADQIVEGQPGQRDHRRAIQRRVIQSV
jgi:hypothetical protein